jgi:hypothetical protein
MRASRQVVLRKREKEQALRPPVWVEPALRWAIECGSRALERLLDRVDGELEGDAACLADALAHSLGELEVCRLLQGAVRAGLGDADHRLARLQLLEGEAIGQDALLYDLPQASDSLAPSGVARDQL